MKRKVAIYARVSTEHEAQISALDNQVQYYTEILERHPEFEACELPETIPDVKPALALAMSIEGPTLVPHIENPM